MQIVKMYQGKTELTQAQKDALFQKARELKKCGADLMAVDYYELPFSGCSVLEYVASIPELGLSERAFVGPRGGLSSGIGANTRRGCAITGGDTLEHLRGELAQWSGKISTL